jgi:hypothetical protein
MAAVMPQNKIQPKSAWFQPQEAVPGGRYAHEKTLARKTYQRYRKAMKKEIEFPVAAGERICPLPAIGGF